MRLSPPSRPRSPGALPRRVAAAVAMGGLALLAACDGTTAADQPTAASSSAAGAATGAATSATDPAGTSAPADPAAAGAPACPAGAELFAGLTADDLGVPGAELELADPSGPASCSGEWALLGVTVRPAPGSASGYPAVALFRYADGAWTAQDGAEACSSGELPEEFRLSACDAS